MQEVPDIHGQDKDPSHLLRWQKLDLQLYLYILYMKFQILKAVFPKVFCDEQDVGNVMLFQYGRDIFESID